MSLLKLHDIGVRQPRYAAQPKSFRVFAGTLLALLGLCVGGPQAFAETEVTEDHECVIPVNKAGEPDVGDALPLIRITVVNVENSDGNLMFSLYDDNPKTFMKYRTYLKKLHAPAMEIETVVCIRAPEPGEFAVTVYHDEDADRDFDRNFLGFPKEGYGFSNNPRIRFPLPRHKDVKFAVAEDETDIEIVLHY